MVRFSSSRICRGVMYLAIGLAVCELAILNVTILYTYLTLHSQITGIFNAMTDDDGYGETPFMDALLKIPSVRDIMYKGKSGGFYRLIQNTVDRVFFVTEDRNVHTSNGSPVDFDKQHITYTALDVSSAGEALYLIRRIKARGDGFSKKYSRLIIDIGANDGLMSSNSFNFIQLGWDAILVEPQISLLNIAKQNIERYADPYNEGRQRVVLVNVLMGLRDGTEDFVLKGNDMESHIFDPQKADEEGGIDFSKELIVQVPSMTVQSFADKYEVPNNFAILSIDAEGMSDKILHQWIDGGYRPAYIVYEHLKTAEPMVHTYAYMKKKGYRFLITLGWNYIFEHVPEDDRNWAV